MLVSSSGGSGLFPVTVGGTAAAFNLLSVMAYLGTLPKTGALGEGTVP